MAQRNTVQIIINAKDDASSVLAGVGGALESVGKFALGAVAVVGGAAIGIGAAIGKLAADAAPLQGISAAFEGLAESANVGADDMLAALERGSAGMISQRELMTSFNKAAQLVSVDFATTLPDAMGSLGKVAAATGEDMGFLLDSLVVGVGRLSPMILDNLGIQVSLTEAYQDWADVNGVAVEEMTKTQQQAALTAQVMTKLADNTASMPDVAGSAAAGMASLSATWENFTDQTGVAFIPALEAVLEPILAIASDAGPQLIEWARLAGEWLGKNIPNAIQIVTSLFEGDFQQALDSARGIIARTFGPEGAAQFDEWVKNLQDGAQVVLDFFESKVIPNFEKVRDWFIKNWPKIEDAIIDAFEDVVSWVQTNWPEFRDAVLATVDTIRAWFEENWPIIQAVALTAFEVIRDIALTVSGIFQDQIVPAFQNAFDSLTEALDALGIDWGDVWNAIKLALGIVAAAIGAIIVGIIAVFTGLATAIAGVVEFISTTFGSLVKNIKKTWEGIAGVIIGGFNVIKGIFTADTELIRAGFDTWWQGMQDLVSGWLGSIVDTFKLAFGIIIEFVAEFVGGVIDFFTGLFDRLVGNSIIPEMMAAMLGIITDQLLAIKGKFVDIFDSIVERVRSKMREIKNAIVSKINEAKSWVAGQVEAWASVGAALIQGLVDGIASMLGAIVDTITSLIANAIAAAKEELGIESPSKVFFEIGRDMAIGLANGIIDESDSVIDAMNDMIKIGGVFSRLGSIASRRLKEELKVLPNAIEEISVSIEPLMEQFSGSLVPDLEGLAGAGKEIADLTLEEFERLSEQITNPQFLRPGQLGAGGVSFAEFNRFRDLMRSQSDSMRQLLELQNERAISTERMLEAEKAILELKRQQEDLAFLQQQIKLLDLIAERGLDAEDILGGLALGIDADALAVAQAMAAAMEEIIAQTEAQLGIASPSRVFENIGAQLMLGLAQGVRDAEFIPRQAATDATGAMVQTVNNNTVHMTVNTQATASNVMGDMQTARALLGI